MEETTVKPDTYAVPKTKAPHPLAREVGQKLKAIREAKGYTQEGLASVLRISGPNLYRIEAGRQWIQPDQLSWLSQLFGEPPSTFFPGGPVAEPLRKITPQEAIETLSEYVAKTSKSLGPSEAASFVRAAPPSPAIPSEIEERLRQLEGHRWTQTQLELLMGSLDEILRAAKQARAASPAEGRPKSPKRG